jgi:competence protein ComEA
MTTAKQWDWWEARGRFILIGIGVGLMILGVWWMVSDFNADSPEVEFYTTGAEEISSPPESLVVDVSGAVNNPAVIELDAGSRVNDAVLKAGGFSDQADSQWVEKNLNMARKLIDGEKIYIPAKGETSNIQGLNVQDDLKSGKYINLNLASKKELETLPGIGPNYAELIIEYREENNGFQSKDELKAVSGIGEKTYEKLKNKISI